MRAKYTLARKATIKSAIIEQISEEVWNDQTENEQNTIIGKDLLVIKKEQPISLLIIISPNYFLEEILEFEDIDEGILKCVKIAALKKLSKSENLPSTEEVQHGKKQRETALENIHRNYQKELDDIMSSIPNTVLSLYFTKIISYGLK